jgi:hypothetical protein
MVLEHVKARQSLPANKAESLIVIGFGAKLPVSNSPVVSQFESGIGKRPLVIGHTDISLNSTPAQAILKNF